MPKLLEYALGDGIHAFSTMRADGTSQGAYAHFNINPYCGDNPEHVAQNLDSLCHMLGIAPTNLVMPHQTHETTVRQVGNELLSMPKEVRQMVLEGVDGSHGNAARKGRRGWLPQAPIPPDPAAIPPTGIRPADRAARRQRRAGRSGSSASPRDRLNSPSRGWSGRSKGTTPSHRKTAISTKLEKEAPMRCWELASR